jgi:hypothetical protein
LQEFKKEITKMKRIITAIVAVVLVLALAAPAMAVEVGTGVDVTQGGGNVPMIKCKWETPDDIPGPGTQIAPPMTYKGYVVATIWVVVTDVEDGGEVAQVVADVFHPEGYPAMGSIKVDNLALSLVPWSEGIAAYDAAEAASIVAYNGFSPEDVAEELVQDEARVWKAEFILHYCQPAGDYRVPVAAVDTHGNTSLYFNNLFNYIPTSGFEIDFQSINYPPVMISSSVVAGGNTIFGDGIPTIRNIGNTNSWLSVLQDDMGFGAYQDGSPKVQFDARLGPKVDDQDSTNVLYNPDVTVQLPNKLELCHTMKMDFSIHVLFAVPGNYAGNLLITSEIAPFGPEDDPWVFDPDGYAYDN